MVQALSTLRAAAVCDRTAGRSATSSSKVVVPGVPTLSATHRSAFLPSGSKAVSRGKLSVRADISAQRAESKEAGRVQYFTKYIDNSTEYFPQWPNKPFCEQTLAKFPEGGVCNVEEARALCEEDGYVFLDVRSEQEVEDDGRNPAAMKIPLIETKRVYNPESTNPGGKDTVQNANPEFLNMIKKKMPNKEQKIVVCCSDGQDRAIQVLELLDGEGYENIVGLRGGFRAWFRTFDNKLNRRREDGYKEDYGGMGETACGIHGTGAQFGRMDALDKIPLVDEMEWLDWSEEMGLSEDEE